MKVRIALSVLSILLVSAVAAPLAMADEVFQNPLWTVEAEPNFVFSGDSFNVTVTEMVEGTKLVALNLRASNGTVISETFLQTDDLGVGNTKIDVPLEATTGLYSLEVVNMGTVETNITIEVVQDDINWLHSLILQDRVTIEQLSAMYFPMAQKLKAQGQTISDLWLIIITVSVIAVAVVLVNLFLFKPWVAWKVARTSSGYINKGLKFFLHPPADGDMTAFMESAKAFQMEVLADRESEGGTATPANPQPSTAVQFEVDEMSNRRQFGKLFRPLRTERKATRREVKMPRKRERREWSWFGTRRTKRTGAMEYEDDPEPVDDSYDIPTFLQDAPAPKPMPKPESVPAAAPRVVPNPPRAMPKAVKTVEYDPISGEEAVVPVEPIEPEPEPIREPEPQRPRPSSAKKRPKPGSVYARTQVKKAVRSE